MKDVLAEIRASLDSILGEARQTAVAILAAQPGIRRPARELLRGGSSAA
jgi:hypothetical protein